jgi:hypothetical protein
MATQFTELLETHIKFIEAQQMYFVGTAASEGLVNISPKGMDSLRVINNNKVTWLNLTGSGNETAAHLLDTNRMTLMFCSFDKKPLVMRLYGEATTHHPRDEKWDELYSLFPDYVGARQIFELDIEMVLTSCGYAVPYYQLIGERDMLTKSANKKGKEGIQTYWQERNQVSLDGKDTGILQKPNANSEVK